MILNALGGPVKIEKFIPYTVVNAETGVVEYPEKSYFYEGIRIDPIPQSLLDEAYQRGYDAGIAEGKPYLYELEYIQSTGTQWIDTGFKPNQNTRVVMDCDVISAPTYPTPFGVRNALNSGQFICLLYSSNTTWFYYGATIYKKTGNILGRHEIDANKNMFYIDGNLIASATVESFSCDYSLYLCAFNASGAPRDSDMTTMKIYSCQIYDNGTLVRDLIPVMDYGGTACLYDKVGKQLYYNKGTGSFAYSVKPDETMYSRKLDYIEFSGTQWIDTGFIPNQNSRVVMDCKANSLTSGGVFPFGVRTSTASQAFSVAVTTTQVFANFYTTYQFANYANPYERMTIDMNKNVITFSGSQNVSISLTNGTFTADGTLILGNMRQAGSVLTSEYGWNGPVHSCQIYDNGTLVRDYISVLDYSGEACLYDKVGKRLYYNQGTGKFYYSMNTADGVLKITSWGDGTDDEIVAMIEASEKGLIRLSDYWSVGDERKVTLSAMSASGVGESHASQEITFVLMNKGGKTLANGKECNFIVGQKDALITAGYMNSSASNTGGWNSMPRRTWCNSIYYNAIPSTLRSIFKQYQNATYNASNAVVTSTDYFALPAEKEVFGATTGSHPTYERDLTQFEYYTNSSNRVKRYGTSGSASAWWSRSPYQSGTSRNCYTNTDGTASSGYVHSALGIAPFGCI